jgi:DeoR/GlpR family transcriptional regulator of sugar metabolism
LGPGEECDLMSKSGGARIRDAFAVERREQILRIVNEQGRVRTNELAQQLEVTEPTIRKDITDLEAQGLLVRAHGGAVARGSMAEVDVSTRETKHLPEKQAIARACVALIRDGDSIFLDGGTTQYELAKLLAQAEGIGHANRIGVKILTTSFKVAELCERMTEPPVVLGGRYRSRGGCFVGPLTMSVLRQFRLDLAFVGVTGVTEIGFCAADLAEAEIKTEAVNRAERAVVPMDHSKIGLADFITVCPLNAVQTVVTDRADDTLRRWLEPAGVELIEATQHGRGAAPRTTGRRNTSSSAASSAASEAGPRPA